MPNRFYSSGKIGSHRSYTPEGFLLCTEVPIARVGELIYSGRELPMLVPDHENVIRIVRNPDELFSEATVASFEGKPVCLGHPTEDVTPDNWSDYAKGTMQNVRRGSGENGDCLIADLLITDKDAIYAVEHMNVDEVSLGYDANYVSLQPGQGKQEHILGNHIAIVSHGRCGPRCAIGDSIQEGLMPKKSLKAKMRAAFRTRDEDGFNDLLDEMKNSDTPLEDTTDEDTTIPAGDREIHIHVGGEASPAAAPAVHDEEPAGGNQGDVQESALDVAQEIAQLKEDMADLAYALKSLLDASEGSKAAAPSEEEPSKDEEAPDVKPEDAGDDTDKDEDTVLGMDEAAPGITEPVSSETDKDAIGTTHDAAALDAEARATFANAEALVPGIRFPTMDAASSKEGDFRLKLNKFRRSTLGRAWKQGGDARGFISSALGGRKVNLRTADAAVVDTIFDAAASLARGRVNDHMAHISAGTKPSVLSSIGNINQSNKSFWSANKANS